MEAEGIICCDNEDGTYDIILDDGNDRDAVARAHIRALPKGGDGMEDGFSARRRTLACANLINSARCAYQTGRLSLSAALATRAIDLNPTNPAAFYVRGRARLAIPFLDLAKEVCVPPTTPPRARHPSNIFFCPLLLVYVAPLSRA